VQDQFLSVEVILPKEQIVLDQHKLGAFIGVKVLDEQLMGEDQSQRDHPTIIRGASHAHHPRVPGAPLKGPRTREVIHPP